MLLTNKARIRAALRRVTAADAGRRVILSAYVGANATEYVAEPRNVQIYCAPNSVGTDPDGIETLLREGARIWFVERLHAKVYWSEHNGCLIGSPYLSTSAFGDLGLFETLYQANEVDVDSLMQRVAQHSAPIEVTPRVLDAFRRKHRRAHGQVLQPAVRRAREISQNGPIASADLRGSLRRASRDRIPPKTVLGVAQPFLQMECLGKSNPSGSLTHGSPASSPDLL